MDEKHGRESMKGNSSREQKRRQHPPGNVSQAPGRRGRADSRNGSSGSSGSRGTSDRSEEKESPPGVMPSQEEEQESEE